MTVAVFVAYSWLYVELPFATARFACAVEFWMSYSRVEFLDAAEKCGRGPEV